MKKTLALAALLVLMLTGCTGEEPSGAAITYPGTVWAYTLADGTEVEITDDGGKTSFTGDRPTPIAIMDGMSCDELAGEADFWSRSKASTSEGARRMLAYYEYAITKWAGECGG